MAGAENGEKPVAAAAGSFGQATTSSRSWKLLALRALAFMATASAAIVMGLNKETKTLVVATMGTNQIKTTLTAKFQHTPAFVFFVIANAMVSFHNLVTLIVEMFGRKLDFKGSRLLAIAILDMLNTSLVAGAANAAVYMAEVGKNGNKHARWDKICDKFDKYCDHGGGAIIASFAGLLLMLALSSASIVNLSRTPKRSPNNYHAVP